jgi:hypothetical protein
MAMNQAMGGVNQQWQAGLQNQFNQGLGLFGNMQQEMKSYNQADVNQYIGQINAANQRRAGRMAFGTNLLSTALTGGLGGIAGAAGSAVKGMFGGGAQ